MKCFPIFPNNKDSNQGLCKVDPLHTNYTKIITQLNRFSHHPSPLTYHQVHCSYQSDLLRMWVTNHQPPLKLVSGYIWSRTGRGGVGIMLRVRNIWYDCYRFTIYYNSHNPLWPFQWPGAKWFITGKRSHDQMVICMIFPVHLSTFCWDEILRRSWSRWVDCEDVDCSDLENR